MTTSHWAPVLRDYPIGPVQLDVLDSLRTLGPSTMGHVEDHTGRTAKELSRVIRRAHARGYVRLTGQSAPSAKRGPKPRIWEITDDGRQVMVTGRMMGGARV